MMYKSATGLSTLAWQDNSLPHFGSLQSTNQSLLSSTLFVQISQLGSNVQPIFNVNIPHLVSFNSFSLADKEIAAGSPARPPA